MSVDIETAAAVIGAAPTEVLAVEETDAGVVLHLFDGSSYIDVPSSTPDADGKSGLMYLTKPTEKYQGTFPVFAGDLPAVTHPAAVAAEAAAEPAEAAPATPAPAPAEPVAASTAAPEPASISSDAAPAAAQPEEAAATEPAASTPAPAEPAQATPDASLPPVKGA